MAEANQVGNAEELLRLVIELTENSIEEQKKLLEKITDALLESLPGQE